MLASPAYLFSGDAWKTWTKYGARNQEARIQGSTLEECPVGPKFVCKILADLGSDEGFVLIGHGFFLKSKHGIRFYTASHVVEKCVLKCRLLSVASYVDVEVGSFVTLEGQDCAYIDVGIQQLMVTLQCKAAMYVPWVESRGQIVTVFASGYSSNGFLKKIQGSVEVSYGGSTLSGFSGAPYYVGNRVFGIHLGDGGSGKNYGLSIGFVLAALRKRVEEAAGGQDTADWLTEGMEDGDMSEVRDWGVDEVIIHTRDGTWHTIDKDVYEEAKKRSGKTVKLTKPRKHKKAVGQSAVIVVDVGVGPDGVESSGARLGLEADAEVSDCGTQVSESDALVLARQGRIGKGVQGSVTARTEAADLAIRGGYTDIEPKNLKAASPRREGGAAAGACGVMETQPTFADLYDLERQVWSKLREHTEERMTGMMERMNRVMQDVGIGMKSMQDRLDALAQAKVLGSLNPTPDPAQPREASPCKISEEKIISDRLLELRKLQSETCREIDRLRGLPSTSKVQQESPPASGSTSSSSRAGSRSRKK